MATTLAGPGAASTAHAQDKAECVRAFDDGQDLRDANRLRDAREKFLTCARDACAAILRKDCAEAAEAAERDTPTVVLVVRDRKGAEVADFELRVDRAVVAGLVPGRAIVLDPGAHTLRVQGSGFEPAEQTITLRMGERNRAVDVRLRRIGEVDLAEPAPLAPSPAPSPMPIAPARNLERGPPTPWLYVAAGVGAVGLASFGVFGLRGTADRSELEDSCAPYCSRRETESARTNFLVADVSLAVGVAGLVVAGVLLLSHARR